MKDELRAPLPLVTDAQADEALHELIETTRSVAEARGAMVKAEAMLKHIKSVYTLKSSMTSVQAREHDATASPAYKRAIEDHVDAVIRFEELKAKRENCVMVIEMWRSAQANLRAARI